jgi:hypothetical protein
MPWRTFAVFLLALNVAAFAFAYLNPKPQLVLPQAIEPNIQALVLLSERDEAQMRAAALSVRPAATSVEQANASAAGRVIPAAAPTNVAAIDSAQYCERIGPLTEAEAAASLRARLGTLSAAAEVKEVAELQLRGYWVYLPQSPDREAALALARQLSAGGIRDYYVVTAGENENTISLGMFHDAVNADKRVRQVAALGFQPKRIERGDTETRYWVEYRAATESKRAIGALRGVAQLRRETIFCDGL